jgi:ribosomal protein S12 methylthiotransferase accessory factor
LASLAPHLADAGITRVGDLTGLDVLGIPVAFAARPNSRSLSVTQGKSLCPVEARIGAIMEAFEQVFAERGEALTACRESTNALAKAGRHPVVAGLRRAARPPAPDEPVPWACGTSLVTGTEVLLPLELVGLDFRTGRHSDYSVSPVSSLGLAAGPSRDAAVIHALLEVMEHGATTAVDMFGFIPCFARPVRHRGGGTPALDAIIESLSRTGLEHALFDLTCADGLPVIGATIDCPDLVPGWIRFAGFACRFSPEHAAEAALLEAVQSRLTLIAGARDDLAATAYRGRPRWKAAIPVDAPCLDDLSHEYASLRWASPAAQIERAVERALASGARDVFAVDVGGITGLVNVVRVVASGIEASAFNGVTMLGQHTLRSLLAAGAVDR